MVEQKVKEILFVANIMEPLIWKFQSQNLACPKKVKYQKAYLQWHRFNYIVREDTHLGHFHLPLLHVPQISHTTHLRPPITQP
jgi:hypothetical protein